MNTLTFLARIRTARELFRWVEGHLMVPYNYRFEELKAKSSSERMNLVSDIFVDHVPIIKKATSQEQDRRTNMPVGLLYEMYRLQFYELEDATALIKRYKQELVETNKELSALKRGNK